MGTALLGKCAVKIAGSDSAPPALLNVSLIYVAAVWRWLNRSRVLSFPYVPKSISINSDSVLSYYFFDRWCVVNLVGDVLIVILEPSSTFVLVGRLDNHIVEVVTGFNKTQGTAHILGLSLKKRHLLLSLH